MAVGRGREVAVGKTAGVGSHKATVKTVGFTPRSTKSHGEFGGTGCNFTVLKIPVHSLTLLVGRNRGRATLESYLASAKAEYTSSL